jgi:probable rRNA maturation factor
MKAAARKGTAKEAAAWADILVTIEHPAWRTAVPGATRLVKKAALAALTGAGRTVRAPAELSVVLADDATVRGLNRDYRGKDKPTNVLSFPLADESAQESGSLAPAGPKGAGRAESVAGSAPVPLLLGDVILAYETVAREADAQSKPLAQHVTHLVVHGVLHLLGFDHVEEQEAVCMESRETVILAGLGIADPYAEPTADPVTGR